MPKYDFPQSEAEWEAYWKAYMLRRRRKPRTTGPRGVPVPGIGKRRFRRYGRKLRPHHGLQPYERPRDGGGRRSVEYD